MVCGCQGALSGQYGQTMMDGPRARDDTTLKAIASQQTEAQTCSFKMCHIPLHKRFQKCRNLLSLKCESICFLGP